MEPSNKFSELVEELALTWWKWMIADTLCRDKSLPYNERAAVALECEALIKNEYEIVWKLDQFFQ